MRSFLFLIIILCILRFTVSHVALQKLDFLNVGKYFKIGRNLLVGDPRYTQVRSMPFDPYQSDRLTSAFQRTYGYRGENLIHALGAGYPLSELKRFNAAS